MDDEKAREVLKALNLKVADLEGQVKLLTQQTLNVESLAGKRVPFFYVIPIVLDQGVSDEQKNSVQMSRSGPFFLERIHVSLHIASMRSGGNAGWVGRQLPVSSLQPYPFIWPLGATGTQARMPPLDFEWRYDCSSSDRQRSDKFVPGDIFARNDSDGILAVSDIFPEGSTVSFAVNPLRPVGNMAPWSDSTGVESFMFTVTLGGYKIIQPTQV